MIKSGYNDPPKHKRWKLFWATLEQGAFLSTMFRVICH